MKLLAAGLNFRRAGAILGRIDGFRGLLFVTEKSPIVLEKFPNVRGEFLIVREVFTDVREGFLIVRERFLDVREPFLIDKKVFKDAMIA